MNEMINESIGHGTQQVVYEFARASTLEGWWSWALLIGSLAALLFVSVRLYRRDVAELPKLTRWTLIWLRLLTIASLIFFFFDLHRRTERRVTRPSEVVILVDTSQSMSLPVGAIASTETRAERAARVLAESDLLSRLEQEHRVSVYAFDQASAPQLLETRGGFFETREDDEADSSSSSFSTLAVVGSLLVALGVLLSALSLLVGAAGRTQAVPWLLAATATSLVLGVIVLGSVYAVHTDQSLTQILGVSEEAAATQQEKAPAEPSTTPAPVRVADWSQAIAATGSQSRIGDALRSILSDFDPSTLSGIVVMTDGQNNGGVGTGAAIAAARRSEVAIFPVGLGSSSAPVNVRVVDLDAPRRVYPGDKFAVTAMLQASGPNNLEVDVQLLDQLDPSATSGMNAADESSTSFGEVVDSQKVKVASDGTLTSVRFEIEPETVGRRRLAIRVVAPEEDQNQRDDARSARYEVVAKKLRVLAIAGGPTREYRFVRNLLFRDKSIELHVWLQTGRPGMSQDADRVLDQFPAKPEELFEYDTIIAFDPDWTAINADSLDLLDRWLSQQAGGLILIAGPVYHPQWTRLRTDPRVSRISGFFPVNLSTRGALLAGGRQGGENSWPFQFTPEARRAEFLWIAEDPADSFDAWEQFGGVYDFVGVKTAKPGAKVYAYFSDPTTEVGGSLPVYLASHFYGAGRVYFQGSGEIWRLRGESDAYFDSYYTKLVRWVSEGRLMRDSTRGVLLVDTSRAMVGETVTVRAILSDDQFEPLDVPQVAAKLLSPSGRIEDISLLPLKGEPRPGTYGGRFVVREAGSYELLLTLGDALEEQVLRQSVQVRLPTVELERPRRNDGELKQLAEMTAGVYTAVDPDTTNDQVRKTLTAELKPQPQTTILPGTPDIDFNRRRNVVLMWLIAMMLTMEWVTRRLHRLA
ncbi:vWA domain-containing protein [Novipirellula artificiosorum]|uniref:von Willebrand factor type A domain protein n=1 Tax=Novipirellula artificiosorum TaxID=2528016 RepID=A0A5C6DZ64_9BACT|nr:VWA domain-containing protein [Novipirellula artificiosorum]TWU42733.1 von Willebrand factor type A domain protein [Novipirellula artificiosorum]